MEIEQVEAVVHDELAIVEGATTERATCLTDIDVSRSLTGMKATTLEEFDVLYRRHASCLGFTARKSTQRLCVGTNNLVKEKYFCCSCAGFCKPTRNASASAPVKKRKCREFPFKRTGCKASIRVKLNNEGLYEVVNHIIKHNHPLIGKTWEDTLRSESCITEEKVKAIEGMAESESESESDMEPLDDSCHHDAVVNESRGYKMIENLQYTKRLRTKSFERDDLQTVFDMLQKNAAEAPNFFFRVKFDSTGRLCGVFWRDSMMKEDYQIYGDVTVFDTSCRKDKYNSICSSFIGINNHKKNVMFGCAFLANENTESFVWLFDVFMESMGGVSPVSIFTDESRATADAVERVFPQSKHRLCLWHLEDHAVSLAQELNCDPSFRDDFNECLRGCVDEEDFQSCWTALISKYMLHEHQWFVRLYQLREKWCTALHKDFFSAGILSYQRIEDLNTAVGFKATEVTSWTQFLWIFKETIQRWRKTEEDDEFECSRSALRSALPMSSLLQHASEVYTLTLFKDFEKEFHAAMVTEGILAFVVGDSSVYEVYLKDDLGSQEQVTYSCVNNSVSVSCSCKTFEECGWLCYHCIKILHMNSVSRIPEQYLVMRWTKFAKKELWESERSSEETNGSTWRHIMARNYYNMLLKCQDNEQAKRVLERGYNRDLNNIQQLLAFSAISKQ